MHHHTLVVVVVVVVVGNHRTFKVVLKFIMVDNLVGVVDILMLKVLVPTFVEQDYITTAVDKFVVRSQLVKVYHLNKLRLEQNFHEQV